MCPMTWDDDQLRKRGRAEENVWAKKHDQELIEDAQRARRHHEAREELRARTGLPEPALDELEALGFTPDTISLLPLVPLVQMAWAEGKVTAAERTTLLNLARTRNIEEGSAADKKLNEWLVHRPAEKVFASAGHLIASMLSGPSANHLSADDVVKYCEIIASASGGMLGIHRISAEERALLASIAAELKGPK